MRMILSKHTVVKIDGIPVTLVEDAVAETSKGNWKAIQRIEEQRQLERARDEALPVHEYS